MTKASNSLRSNLLVSKAWESISDADLVLYVVDSAKRLSFEVKHSLVRLNKLSRSIDPQDKRVINAILDDSFSEQRFHEGEYSMTEQEK